MEISRRHAKIGNKENAEPAALGSKKSKALSGASIHPKRMEKQSNRRAGGGGGGGGSTQGDAQLLKTSSAVQKNTKAMPAGKTDNRQTLSQAFLAEQAVKQKKILDAAKPQPPHAHGKPTAGLYKGKVIQSKIGSFRTSSVIAGEGDRKPTAKPAAARVQSRRVDHATKRRSLSVTELPGHGETQKTKPKPARSNSVSDSPRQAPKRSTVTARPPTALRSAPLPPPPPRASRPAAAPVSARTGAADRGTETKVVGEKRVSKPSVSSSLSQYRVSMESMEERRAKLADWLASKGKAPRRPVMLARLPAKTKVPAQHHVEPETAVQRDPEPEPEPEPSQDLLAIAMATAVVAGLCADQPGDSVRVADPASDASSPLTANATPGLMDNSDSDSDTDTDLPVDPEPGVNDIVVNLCDALSALATNEEAEAQQKGGEDDCEMSSGAASEDEQNKETSEEVVDCKAAVKTDVETGSDVTSEEETEVYCKEYEVDEVDGKDEVKPQTEVTTMTEEDASSVKFNVRTTPYLQSMRKGLQRESRSATGPRRRKPDIKELKFLTPVRRSSRIHRNSARLPALVRDHDPCVTTLAELARLDGGGADGDAYIYRRNPALLQDSHDPKEDLLK